MPDYKILHDAGYNVLVYDFRNYGLSGAANGGVMSCGVLEARDVIGSLAYVRGRTDLRDMAIGLALAENSIYARQAACWYSWRIPPRRWCLPMFRWAI